MSGSAGRLPPLESDEDPKRVREPHCHSFKGFGGGCRSATGPTRVTRLPGDVSRVELVSADNVPNGPAPERSSPSISNASLLPSTQGSGCRAATTPSAFSGRSQQCHLGFADGRSAWVRCTAARGTCLSQRDRLHPVRQLPPPRSFTGVVRLERMFAIGMDYQASRRKNFGRARRGKPTHSQSGSQRRRFRGTLRAPKSGRRLPQSKTASRWCGGEDEDFLNLASRARLH